MNISYIIRIESRTAPIAGVEQSYVPMPFQKGSAAYGQKETRSSQGSLYNSTLSFKIAGITSESEAAVNRFRKARNIRITDINGWGVVLGGSSIRLDITREKNIEGTPGSFRGYKIKVEWNTPRPPAAESFI